MEELDPRPEEFFRYLDIRHAIWSDKEYLPESSDELGTFLYDYTEERSVFRQEWEAEIEVNHVLQPFRRKIDVIWASLVARVILPEQFSATNVRYVDYEKLMGLCDGSLLYFLHANIKMFIPPIQKLKSMPAVFNYLCNIFTDWKVSRDQIYSVVCDLQRCRFPGMSRLGLYSWAYLPPEGHRMLEEIMGSAKFPERNFATLMEMGRTYRFVSFLWTDLTAQEISAGLVAFASVKARMLQSESTP